jgi:hypothetical protein
MLEAIDVTGFVIAEIGLEIILGIDILGGDILNLGFFHFSLKPISFSKESSPASTEYPLPKSPIHFIFNSL